MTLYSEDFKISIIQRMMPPQSESVASLAKEIGISEAALYKWKKNAKAEGIAIPNGKTIPERWSTQDKFSIVVETAAMSEIELAEYGRSKGLYIEQIQAWRDACILNSRRIIPRMEYPPQGKCTDSFASLSFHLSGVYVQAVQNIQ